MSVMSRRAPRKREGLEGTHAAPGWSDEDVPESVTLGKLQVPERFRLLVRETDRSDAHEVSAIVAYFEVRDAAIELRQVFADPDEVPEALDYLRGQRAIEEWKRMALMMLAADATAFELRARGATDPEAVGAAIRRAHGTPLARRRNRITGAHLQQVAETYREAWQTGEPPTQAVALHYGVSHSTAARWIGQARNHGHLGPPAPGGRGGEAESDG
jgi:hypothetical protein